MCWRCWQPTTSQADTADRIIASAGCDAIVAADSAYTSRWGRKYWLPLLKRSYDEGCSGHHAAAVLIARRGLGIPERRATAETLWKDRVSEAADPQVVLLTCGLPPNNASLLPGPSASERTARTAEEHQPSRTVRRRRRRLRSTVLRNPTQSTTECSGCRAWTTIHARGTIWCCGNRKWIITHIRQNG